MKGIKRLPKGTVNFFRNSRFPLGMPSGWTIRRENIYGSVGAAPDVPGPSGAPSLKIDFKPLPPPRPWANILYSEPFQIDDPERNVQVSFQYKSDQNWHITAGDTSKTIPASKKWRRFEFSFSPESHARAFNLTFQGEGVMYLDSLMAHSGEPGTPYTSVGKCEIALAHSDSELKGTHVVFDDEPALVRYAATGQLDGAVMKAKIVNVYGKEKILDETYLSSHPSGNIDFNVFPEAPYGAFRVEVWAERNGKRISPYNELVMNRVRRPVYWGKDAPDSPFGGHFIPKPRVLKTVKAGGFNWQRVHDTFMNATCWAHLEPERGKWVFADDRIQSYRDVKLLILGQIGTAPEWASYFHGERHPNSYFNILFKPKDEEAFRNYVRTLVSRYKGVIDEYQFWNEPWSDLFWHETFDFKTNTFKQGENPASDYARLSQIAYKELKKANPEAKMYGFNTTHNPRGVKWTESVFKAGAYDYCDMINYHYYNNMSEFACIPDDQVTKAYNRALGYIINNVDPPLKPIVMSEGNPTRSGSVAEMNRNDYTGLMKHTLTWPEENNTLELADMTCRYVISHLALGAKRIFLYSDHCYNNMLKAPSFPVVLGMDGYPHPTFAAFSNMAWLLEDRSFEKRIPMGENVWGYVFSGRGKSVTVVSGAKNAKCALPVVPGAKVLDLFGNPLPTGRLYEGNLIYILSH